MVKIKEDDQYQSMKDYKKRGLFCEYEHCIESMPLVNGYISCPVWGHDCPGGIDKKKACGKTINDIPEKRIYRGKIKIIEGKVYKDES